MIHRVVSPRWRAIYQFVPILAAILVALAPLAPTAHARTAVTRTALSMVQLTGWQGLTVDEAFLVCSSGSQRASHATSTSTTRDATYTPPPIRIVRYTAPRYSLPRSPYGDARWNSLTDEIVGADGKLWEPFDVPGPGYFTGATWVVTSGSPGSVSAVINAAQDKDIVEIPVAVYQWTATTPLLSSTARGNAGYVLVRSANYASLPATGTKVTAADLVNMPTLQFKSITTTQSGMEMENRTRGLVFHGIHWKLDPTQTTVQTTRLVGLRPQLQGQLAEQVSYFAFKQCAVRCPWELGVRAAGGIDVRCSFYHIKDCLIDGWSEDLPDGSAPDSQAILVMNSLGFGIIEHNEMEAGGETMLFGGAASLIGSACTNGDLIVRNNRMFRRTAWDNIDGPKNFVEVGKNAIRVVVEGNECENHNGDGQVYDFLMAAAPQTAAESWVTCKDITLRYNFTRRGWGKANVSARNNAIGGTKNLPVLVETTRRIQIIGNLWADSRIPSTASENRFQVLVTPYGQKGTPDVSIEWNTADIANNAFVQFGGTSTVTANGAPGFNLNNNIAYGDFIDLYGINNSSGNGSTVLDAVCGVGLWSVSGNLMRKTNGSPLNDTSGWTGTLASGAVGVRNYNNFGALIAFANTATYDYTLTDARYLGISTKLGSPGCDMGRITTMRARVV